MNGNNFEKWIVETVLPRIPPKSVLIMDNAPFHMRLINKPPAKSSLKRGMVDYLRRNGVTCEEAMRKATPY